MGWSFVIARVFGISIRIHLFLPLFVGAMVASAFVRGPSGAGLEAVLFYGLLFVSVLLHEFGHCFAAARLGGRPKEILLWLLGGVSSLEDTPQRPWPQMLIAGAGPAVNLLIAVTALLSLAALGADITPVFGGPDPFSAASILRLVWAVNGVLFLFNLLPALPLDGGSVLRWALTERLGFANATYLTARVGQALAVILGVAALVFQIPLLYFVLFAALFIFLESERQKKMVRGLETGPFTAWSVGESAFTYTPPPPPRPPSYFERLRSRREARRREQEIRDQVETREKVDELLDKINRHGMDSLSEREKAFLEKASRIFGNNRKG
jgi:Zn-dependent protease